MASQLCVKYFNLNSNYNPELPSLPAPANRPYRKFAYSRQQKMKMANDGCK